LEFRIGVVEKYDCLILGAGAAGLFCAARTAARGRRTLVIDHSAKPAEKVRISGGGRCNFTNLNTRAETFLSDNPHFAKSALARYQPEDFCALMQAHGLSWTEKTLGQLFCDQKSGAIIEMLLKEVAASGASLRLNTPVSDVRHTVDGFVVSTPEGPLQTESLVVATGGLSIPKMGATGLAYDVARQFGHEVVPVRPALVPFVFDGETKADFATLAGVSLPVRARTGNGPSFDEALLFTHRGLSGPAILQASSYWAQGEALTLNLLAEPLGRPTFAQQRQDTPSRSLQKALGNLFPARLAPLLTRFISGAVQRPLQQISERDLRALDEALTQWTLHPSGTEGWRTAEVTAGGVATNGLSSRTLASHHVKGLFFIGECVDVTGWLGGYNFQWAWASAAAAAEVA
jgi:predicted Rossmann fold flavoprotein